jgi:hypothetical protein
MALLELAERREYPPCLSDPERWTGDSYDARCAAALDCAPCPVLGPCRDADEGEAWGMFGGVDRTPTTRKGPGEAAHHIRRAATNPPLNFDDSQAEEDLTHHD